MTSIEQLKLIGEHSSSLSRLTTKMIPIIQKTYTDINLIDLLMALPIKFELNEVNEADLPEKKDGTKITLKEVALGGYITRDQAAGNPDRLVVFLTFTKSINESWDNFFRKLVDDSYYPNTLAFIYMHEAMHILLRHYDFYLNSTYENIVKNIRNDLTEDLIHKLLNHGFDYYINGYLMENANRGSQIHDFTLENSNCPYLYDANLSPNILQQSEIVQKLAKEAEINSQDIKDQDGNIIGQMTEITINGNTSSSISINGGQGEVVQQPRPDQSEQEINDVLDNARANLLEKTRGNENKGSLSKLGIDYNVPTDWFKVLKNSLFTMVRHHTSNYEQTWGKIKNKMRHISMMPGRVYYEKELAVVVSIDQSGSMSNDDLEKINYVVTELAKKAVFVEIMLHDTVVASRQKFIGKQFKGIREFVTNRVAHGGTSHKEVFENIDEIRRQNPKVKLIYLSFSDNWSDIDQTYPEELFRKITPYWITTDEKNLVKVPGLQISLLHGIIKE